MTDFTEAIAPLIDVDKIASEAWMDGFNEGWESGFDAGFISSLVCGEDD